MTDDDISADHERSCHAEHTDRARFAELLEERNKAAAEKASESVRKALQTEYETAIIAAAVAAGLGKRLKFDRACKLLGNQTGDLIKKIRAPFEERVTAHLSKWESRVDELEGELEHLAKDLPIHMSVTLSPEEAVTCKPLPDGAYLLLAETHASAWRSQGLGAERYAQAGAEVYADIARAIGVPVRIERIECPSDRLYGTEFRVYVGVESKLDIEILRRKPTLPLREQVRLSWKRGVNPRVFNPFLPHGYEEKVGIDFFGNNVEVK